MSLKNFLNSNEVFPILDMIQRERMKGKGIHVSGGGSGDTEINFDASSWQVESMDIIRDSENKIDPNIIREIILVYRNGITDHIKLIRGLEEPVDSSVPDSEYINHIMIREVFIETVYAGLSTWAHAFIHRENGYGLVQRVELKYDDDIEYDDDDMEYTSNNGVEY